MLPAEVLEASAKALVDFQGKGFGIAECSHRGKEFDAVLDESIARCRSLLDIPETHDVLFLQGGATQLFNTIPMNILTGPADYVVGGEWSKKAADAAKAAQQTLDRAASRGYIHPNKAARLKARMAKKLRTGAAAKPTA